MARQRPLRFVLRQDGGLPRIQKRYRWDHVIGCWVTGRVARHGAEAAAAAENGPQRVFISVITDEDPKPAIDA